MTTIMFIITITSINIDIVIIYYYYYYYYYYYLLATLLY